MLIVENNGNWEKSHRVSTIYPEAKVDGGTMFLPVNITDATVVVPVTDESGEQTATEEVAGYAFDEYRINKAVDLPEEAAAALAAAFQISTQALKILGVV